ncbi:MAG: hypothetical protein H7281_12745 [Bacteriovorax sp.]|nr:hypothetical protein [Bacteriovorax sp.]
MTNIPGPLNERITKAVYNKLHPKMSALVAKVFAIHMATAVVTLSMCPQFGFSTFKLHFNLMYSFMVFGMPVCNFLCGLFFTMTSTIMASIILKRDEVRALKFHKTLASSLLILTSIGFFGIMNPDFFLEFSFLWLLGAILGVVLTLEVSSRILARA